MAYVALLLYVAILFLRPQEWKGSFLYNTPIQEFTMGAAIATWLGSVLISRWKMKDAPQNWLLVGLFAAAVISHMSHTYFDAAWSTFKEFGKIAIVYILVSSLLTDVRRAKGLILVMVVGCVFLACVGITEWNSSTTITTGEGIFPGTAGEGILTGAKPVWQETQWRVRGTGIFEDPNDLALALVTILPFLMTNLWRRGHGLMYGCCRPALVCRWFSASSTRTRAAVGWPWAPC